MKALEDCTVLVVDDTETNVDILVEILGDRYNVSVAMDGESALDIVKNDPPDVILLDVMMPGMDGHEVCRRLKGNPETRNIPVIFVTAMNQETDEETGFALGAVDYITKPVCPPIVEARVRTHLELKLAREDLEKQNEILRESILIREEVERITQHDMKTPLSAVINIPGMLAKEPNLTPDQVELLKMLEETGYRMLEIVNSSLDLYKMETGQYKPDPVPVDLVKLVAQIRGETRQLIQSKGLKISASLDGKGLRDGDSFIVQGEEMLLYSMLANLLKNAVEASPEGGTVGIGFQSGDVPVVAVRNMGAVPAEIRDRFFEKYATAGKAGGTGLGTYSAKLIAEALGGKILMKTSETDGTVVAVRFSGLPAAPPVKKRAPSSRGNPQTARVLVADDYTAMRRTVIGLLRQMGFRNFMEATDGVSAKAILDSKPVDLVVSDWNMPGMTGLDLLTYVRSQERLRNVPFIMLTGEAKLENITAAAAAGIGGGYILKPFTPDSLKKKIAAYFQM